MDYSVFRKVDFSSVYELMYELRTYYELLEVDPEAELGVIEKAYESLSAKYHPENKETGYPYMYNQVAEAWSNLRTLERRERYDKYLARIVHSPD